MRIRQERTSELHKGTDNMSEKRVSQSDTMLTLTLMCVDKVFHEKFEKVYLNRKLSAM